MIRMVILALTLAVGAGAAWMLYGNMTATPEAVVEAPQAPAAPPPPDVLVAGVPIAVGDVIVAESFSWEPRADNDPAAGHIRRSDRPDARVELVGRIARSAFAAGDPIVAARLAEGGAGYLATLLAAGERAVAVLVSAENTAGGFILPGDRVDVLYTGSGPDTARVSTHTILENVEVLAIDQTTIDGAVATDAFVGRTATLRVDREQAERVTGAKTTGELSLSLRAYADAAIVMQAPSEAPAPRERAPIRIRRGGLLETVDLQ